MKDDHHKNIRDLCMALLMLENEAEAYNFLKDLCTPGELLDLAERWQICQYLDKGMSYREIHTKVNASLTTIGRVARFLKDEPYHGYATLLDRWRTKMEKKNE